jgi:hypothetical protein
MLGLTVSSTLPSAEYSVVRTFVRWCVFLSRIGRYLLPPLFLHWMTYFAVLDFIFCQYRYRHVTGFSH